MDKVLFSSKSNKKIKILTIDDLEKAFKESVYKNQVKRSQDILDNYFKENKDGKIRTRHTKRYD